MKLPRYELVTWDWRDMDGAVDELIKALKKLGVSMAPMISTEGSDTYGFVLALTNKPLTSEEVKAIEEDAGTL